MPRILIERKDEGCPQSYPVYTNRAAAHKASGSKAVRPAVTLLLGLVLIAATLCPSAAVAQPLLPVCSWRIETTGTGPSNVAYPDTGATYWTMPFDSSESKEMIITGTYPEARFHSFITYDARGALVDSIVDSAIKPDLHSNNPFKSGEAGSGQGHTFGRSYAVTINRDGQAAKGGNHLRAADSSLGWVIYRVYVADIGEDRKGGVELPAVTLIAHDGSVHPLSLCPPSDFATSAESLIMDLSANGFDDAANFLETKINEGDDGDAGPEGSCAPDQVAFAIPQNTGGYFPNAANKYIAAPRLCFQQNRIIVVRGKGATFPDTHSGAPFWQPPGQFDEIEMRYWSMCNNDQVSPYPVVACHADWDTNVDSQGFYTYVVSEDESGIPAWLPADATWLPWGSKVDQNILLVRNMLPASSFHSSVQTAEAAGCTFTNESEIPPPYEDIVDAGQCAQQVMGAYFPVAVYCDQDLFISQGWQGCFAAAGVAVP